MPTRVLAVLSSQQTLSEMSKETLSTRRESIQKGVALFSTAPAVLTTDESWSTDATTVVLRSTDVPSGYESQEYQFEQASSLNWLSDIETPAESFDLEGSCYLLHEAEREIGAIASTAVVFPDGEADPEIVPVAYGRGSGTPPFQLGDYPLYRSIQSLGRGLEIQYDLPDPPWQLDASFRDVTCVHAIEDTIVGTVVYGPVTDGHRPKALARELNSLMQTRVVRGEPS